MAEIVWQYFPPCRHAHILHRPAKVAKEIWKYVEATNDSQPRYKEDLKAYSERWGAGVETQKNVRGEIGGWGRVPFDETYAPSLSTIYDGA